MTPEFKEQLKERWLPVGIVAAGLFLLNVVARWVAKGIDTDSKKNVAGLVTLGIIGLVFLGLAIYWGRIRPPARVAADLAVAAVVGCLLSVLIGPFLAGGKPFDQGPGQFFGQIWIYAALAGGGALLGMLGLIAFTADYRSKQLKAFSDRRKGLPKRV